MTADPKAGAIPARAGELAGKVALVPGASGGIGRAVAELLAERGAYVILGYRRNSSAVDVLVERLREAGGAVEAAPMDARKPESIRTWVQEAVERHGRIDILANCLGWQGEVPSFQPFAEQQQEHWTAVLDVELGALLHLAHAVVPIMTGQGDGRIVTVGSDSSKVGEGGAAVNAAARGACNAFSKSLAREVGRHGITVNTVCPGPTETPLLTDLASRNGGDKLIAKMTSLTAMKRIGTAREVAQVVAFLASPDASYVTGQAISVSGGLTMC